jgi:hypothetical protein
VISAQITATEVIPTKLGTNSMANGPFSSPALAVNTPGIDAWAPVVTATTPVIRQSKNAKARPPSSPVIVAVTVFVILVMDIPWLVLFARKAFCTGFARWDCRSLSRVAFSKTTSSDGSLPKLS